MAKMKQHNANRNRPKIGPDLDLNRLNAYFEKVKTV